MKALAPRLVDTLGSLIGLAAATRLRSVIAPAWRTALSACLRASVASGAVPGVVGLLPRLARIEDGRCLIPPATQRA